MKKKKKKPLTLIRVIRNNKNPPKENRERESKCKIYERMKEV